MYISSIDFLINEVISVTSLQIVYYKYKSKVVFSSIVIYLISIGNVAESKMKNGKDESAHKVLA